MIYLIPNLHCGGKYRIYRRHDHCYLNKNGEWGRNKINYNSYREAVSILKKFVKVKKVFKNDLGEVLFKEK